MPFSFLASLFTNKVNRDSQYQHDRDMYNMQRRDYLADREYSEKYNSPSAQVQRLKDAGLNPSLAMSNIQTGQVTSPSSPNAQSSSVAHAASNLTNGVLGMLGLKSDLAIKHAQAKDIAADAKLKEIKAETEARENLARISKIEGEGRESWKRGDHIDSDMTARYQKMMSEIGVNASTSEVNWAIHAMKMQELKYLPIDKALDWIEQVGRVMESYSRQEVNRRQVQKLIEEATAARFGWKDKKFQYELNKKTENYLIKMRESGQYKDLTWQGLLFGKADQSEGFFK